MGRSCVDENIKLLKSKKSVESFLHSVYLETVKGAVLEYFVDHNVFDAWAQMQMFITDLRFDDFITDEEEKDLIRFVNTVYLEFCDAQSDARNQVINIRKKIERG